MGASILIVEDDQRLAALLVDLLTQEGYAPSATHDGREAIARVLEERPDLVLLDLGLPGADGFEVLRATRARYPGRVILLTARDGEEDEVRGLDLGADDYVAKPLRPAKLLARVRAQLRHLGEGRAEASALVAGPLHINLARREVTCAGEPLPLTSADFELLLFLAQRGGEVVTRDALSMALIGRPYDGLDRTVDLRVHRLRRALSSQVSAPSLIKTVRGVGYLLVTA